MSEVLKQFSEISGQIYLNGRFSPSAASAGIDVIDPATENTVGSIPETTAGEIDMAVGQANAAQVKWWRKSALERAHDMHLIADKIDSLRPVLAEAMTREMGKPYKESVDEVNWCIHAFRYYAEMGRNDCGRVIGPAVPGQFHYTLKEPLGTAVLIMPFNYPLVLLAWEAAAALAAGNAIVVKPSEYTSLTTLLYAQAFDVLPEGLFQVVTGGGDAGRRLVEHAGTHVVAFTGSVPVGRSVARACGDLLKPSLIETSGNDPFIVMPSAPLDMAARAAAFSAYMNCGQICVSAERFFVHESIHDAFVEKLAEHARAIRVGNGLDKVEMGPLVSQKERDRYEGVLETAKGQGARAYLGGGRPADFNRGWFVEPTILVDCDTSMDIFNQESFGPVAPICKVSSFDQAMDLANDSNFGLGANIYTSDLSEAHAAANNLQAGMVWVNAPLLDNDAGPFGGTKLSGMGRQLGSEGLETFRQTKTVMIDPDCQSQDFWWFPYDDAESFPGSGA